MFLFKDYYVSDECMYDTITAYFQKNMDHFGIVGYPLMKLVIYLTEDTSEFYCIILREDLLMASSIIVLVHQYKYSL